MARSNVRAEGGGVRSVLENVELPSFGWEGERAGAENELGLLDE